MAEYIDREIAAKGLRMAHDYDGEAYINAIPAVDVAPVVHAHWCEDPVFDNFYYCSHCYAGFKSDYTVLVDEKYCGNCGARMDESEGENNG